MQAAAWTALNGVGLALVMPCVQAILAEVYYARQRGRAFGLLFTISAFGGMLFNFVAVTFGDRTVGGLPVCCCAFYSHVALFAQRSFLWWPLSFLWPMFLSSSLSSLCLHTGNLCWLPASCCPPLQCLWLPYHSHQSKCNHAVITVVLCPVQGWRVIFFIVASFAFVSGVLVFIGGIEPRDLEKKVVSEADRREQQESPMKAVLKGILVILNSVQRVFRIRSFQVILVVGIIETFHWVRLQCQ